MLGQKSFIILASRVIGSIFALIGMLFITRYLGPGVYGTVAWGLAFVAIFNTIAELGFNAAHVKRVSEGRCLEDCVSTYTTIKIALTAVMVTVVLLYVALLSLAGSGLSSDQLGVVLLFILYYVFYDLANIAWTTYEAKMEASKNQLIIMVDPLVRLPLVILISVYGLGAIQLAAAYAVGGSAMLIVGIWFMRRDKVRWKKPTMFRSYIKFAIPVTAINIFGTVSWNLDKIFIGWFGTDVAVGYFSGSQTLLGVLGFLGIAISTITFPAISQLMAEKRMDEVKGLTWTAERYISMLGLPLIVATIVAPTQVAVTFLGPAFAPAGEAMQILAIATFATMLTQAYVPQIVAMDRPSLLARMMGVVLASNLVLLIIFVPSDFAGVPMLGWGFVGAAVVGVIISVAVLLYTRRLASSMTGAKGNPRILIHFLAAGITGVLLALLLSVWTLSYWYDLVVYGLIAIGIFAGLLFVMRELTGYDITYFRAVISPKEVSGYVSKELKRKKE
ncbi:MAG: flippase [Methanomassiliicoccales archaeon]|nr:flippase [Methanomassiliicoccales archaeon]